MLAGRRTGDAPVHSPPNPGRTRKPIARAAATPQPRPARPAAVRRGAAGRAGLGRRLVVHRVLARDQCLRRPGRAQPHDAQRRGHARHGRLGGQPHPVGAGRTVHAEPRLHIGPDPAPRRAASRMVEEPSAVGPPRLRIRHLHQFRGGCVSLQHRDRRTQRALPDGGHAVADQPPARGLPRHQRRGLAALPRARRRGVGHR